MQNKEIIKELNKKNKNNNNNKKKKDKINIIKYIKENL